MKTTFEEALWEQLMGELKWLRSKRRPVPDTQDEPQDNHAHPWEWEEKPDEGSLTIEQAEAIRLGTAPGWRRLRDGKRNWFIYIPEKLTTPD